ncbi:MAG: EF-P lysine aminoacylase EpmA [Desulfosalsimonadaceae bacterium]|nr:EF-P lysine aminoacylase EpmA [Desulfosalsimonadaceae bacterium]
MNKSLYRRKNLALRQRILQAIRDYFTHQGFLEVDTPIRIPAPAPEPYISPQPAGSWYLQTSPEVCMKRLLAAGFPKIFQICKCFRREERGNRHLQEFTMLEWYEAGATYRDLMDRCEAMIDFIRLAPGPPESFHYKGQDIDLSTPWERLTVADAFSRYAPISMDTAMRTGAFDETIAFDIEPNLGTSRPVFLYDYPASTCGLAAPKPEAPHLIERFELYIGALELCNGFTELTDPVAQRNHFEAELENRKQNNLPPMPMPEKFLDDLHLMPPAAGNALGIDRLTMLFAGADRIDEVVAFTPEEL